MGYRLKMSAEIYDWLAELRDSDPPTAILAAQALTALADNGDRLGPPLVTAVAPRLPPDELESALDQHYQDQLESLTLLRRRVAQRPLPSPHVPPRATSSPDEGKHVLSTSCKQRGRNFHAH